MKLFIGFLFAQSVFGSVYCAKYSQSGDVRLLIETGWRNRIQKAAGLSERVSPRFFVEGEPVSDERLTELCAPERSAVENALSARQVREVNPNTDDAASAEGRDEVFTIVQNGPSKNRIDLVFMGDGYLETEKEKFLSDMKRLTHELFGGKTFASYLPIFNVYAVFRASNVSGIGKNDTPKDTAYKLYRLGNTLRAIYVGNPMAAHNSCGKAPGCDYPILIANDPYYGGLGGEFSVSTSSATSGMVVLRHELGHSVGDIGEEYDGGGYFGANHASSIGTLGWKHWLTGTAKAEPSQARDISWPWVNLSAGPFSSTFSSNGLWNVIGIQLSVSGAQTDADIAISLDGTALPFHSPGHGDRDFHSFTLNHGFTSGSHELKFWEGVSDGDNWVSNITVHEYRSDYHFDPGYIGAYPLFAGTRREGFRPTHDTCLMRNMKSESFCPVCQENNWIKFFGSIEMIDGIQVTPDVQAASLSGRGLSGAIVKVTTQPLGQFVRASGQASSPKPVGHVAVRWFKNGAAAQALNDKTQAHIDDTQARWEVEVSYETPEVRKDPLGQLKTKRTITFYQPVHK